MRIVEREDDRWAVQYGYWARRGATRRFVALAEWPASSYVQAHAVVAREKINLISAPIPVDAEPLPERHVVTRAINEAQTGSDSLLRKALAGLPDPLPEVDALHKRMDIDPPMRRGNGRQFMCYLPEPVYGKLCAMAIAADTSRNQIVEALLLNAEE